MTEMTVAKAWDDAFGLIKADGMEPTEDFKKYVLFAVFEKRWIG